MAFPVVERVAVVSCCILQDDGNTNGIKVAAFAITCKRQYSGNLTLKHRNALSWSHAGIEHTGILSPLNLAEYTIEISQGCNVLSRVSQLPC